jgi:hypothetical protein
MTDPTGFALSVLGSIAGGAVTVLAVTWRIAGKIALWTYHLKSMSERLDEHAAEDDKFASEARETWHEINRALGRLEGETWAEKTNPGGRNRER